MDVTDPFEDDTADGLPLRLSERIARASSEGVEPRITLHEDGSTEIELEVHAIADAALPRPEPHLGMVRRFSRRFSGKGETSGTVRYVTRQP